MAISKDNLAIPNTYNYEQQELSPMEAEKTKISRRNNEKSKRSNEIELLGTPQKHFKNYK